MQPEPSQSSLKVAVPAPASIAAVAEFADDGESRGSSTLTQSVHLQKADGTDIHGKLLKLAREIRRGQAYVGHSFFLLFGLLKKYRPFVWEGENLVDLIGTFAPWALEQCTGECAVQGICVCFEVLAGGECRMVRVSEDHPLGQTKHFLAAATIGHDLPCDGDSLQAFYQRRGVAVLGTVVDGDCGVDCACMMLSLRQCLDERMKLREEVSDFLLERVDEDWMQDMMVACGELDGNALAMHRDCRKVPSCAFKVVDLTANDDVLPTEKDDSAVAELPARSTEDTEKYIPALMWSTGLDDAGILHGLLRALPDAVLHEQLHAYEQRGLCDAPQVVQVKIKFPERRLLAQDDLSAKFDAYLREKGLDDEQKLPKNSVAEFLKETCVVPVKCKSAGTKLRRWHARWRKGRGSEPGEGRGMCLRAGKLKAKLPMVRYHKRQRGYGEQGILKKMPWVRQELFEWFVGMRYQIDWKALERTRRSSGERKCVGRFPRSMVRQKLNDLIQEYCAQCLLQGYRPKVSRVRSRWFDQWEAEHGLCMRQPNRRYKLPKRILEERLSIWWITLARLRTLALECLGYDLEMENFDQSPFHNNEVGAQNKKTLAVAGLNEVPLIEGRHDCLQRWTGNFTTWSDSVRVEQEGPPYCELMFKGTPDGRMTLQLREHLRSCGYGAWLTVACQEKGSYRESDVINFLERHLPLLVDRRRWRIMMSDDYGPHKSEAVFDLCWSRGYVMVNHGGGATPVAQTPDTDLNQHVRREYSAKEAAELMYQMRTGVAVPCPKKEACIDMMHDVLSSKQLHLHAAKGFKATGATVALDGSEDHLITREAGDFFHSLGMRKKIDREVEHVEEEARAGRLVWTKADVKRLIGRYPARSEYDQVLERIGEHAWVEEGDTPWQDEEEDKDDESDVNETAEDSGLSSQEEEPPGPVAAVAEAEDVCLLSPAEKTLPLTAEQAEDQQRSQSLIHALTQSLETLREVGAVACVANLENEIRKERRRVRALASEEPAVAAALAKRRDEEQLSHLQRQREVAIMNRKREAACAVQKELMAASDLLRKRKAEMMAHEKMLESRHAIKTFSVDLLGQGCANAGGIQARRRRHEVLDRMAKLGSGLSAPQRNDWEWFKLAWDEKMKNDHGENWGKVFAGQMQRILDDSGGASSNVFSLFVNSETTRCFEGVLALQVPGSSCSKA